MDNFFTKVKNFIICNFWIFYMILVCLFVVSPNPFSWKNLILIGGTFLLNLYKDKVRDKLKEVERNL
jgi:valyl-tRNA synthetase